MLGVGHQSIPLEKEVREAAAAAARPPARARAGVTTCYFLILKGNVM